MRSIGLVTSVVNLTMAVWRLLVNPYEYEKTVSDIIQGIKQSATELSVIPIGGR